MKTQGPSLSTRGRPCSGPYLCHTRFPSNPVDTDTLRCRGDTAPRVHNDTVPHSCLQTSPAHTLEEEGARQSFSSSTGDTRDRLTSLTALSHPAGAAAAPSALPVTLAPVLTLTPLLAVRPEPPRCTLCENTQQHVGAAQGQTR